MVSTFSGTSEHGLDDKGRLILPNRILDEVKKSEWKFHLSAGLDRCLLLHDHEGWLELTRQIGRAVPGSRAHRNLVRRFVGCSELVEPDANRRIRIPDSLMKYAGLAAGGQVVLLGMGRVCELWAPDQMGVVLAEATPDEESLFVSLVEPNKPSTSTGT